MNEEAVKYAFDLFVRDGYKGDLEKFQKLLATNQEALDYSFTLFERDGYKGGKDKYKGLMGLGEVTAPVATTAPVKTEVATTTPVAETKPTVTPEPTKELRSEPMATVKAQALPEKQVATPTVDMAKMPTIQVKSVEATPTKEEPMTADKQEVVKSDIESQLLPVTEKTEVKAIETPSDKMVIKSEAKAEQPKAEVKPTEVAKVEVKDVPAEESKMKVMTKEEKKEWQCPPSEGGCPKNKDVVHNYFDEKYKDKDYTPIIDREGNLAKFIDDGARGVPITEYYGRKSYTHDSYGFTYSAEELPKSERFSVYNVPIEGKETSLIYDNKTGVIMKDTGDAIKTEDGKQMKT